MTNLEKKTIKQLKWIIHWLKLAQFIRKAVYRWFTSELERTQEKQYFYDLICYQFQTIIAAQQILFKKSLGAKVQRQPLGVFYEICLSRVWQIPWK